MFKYLIILLAAILPFNTALATEEPAIIYPLEGRLGQLRPDSFALVKDAGFFEDLQRNPKKFLSTGINNIITFSIDEGSTLYLKSPFKATIVYRLYYSFKNTPTTEDSLSENQTLEITYDTAKANAYSARNSFVFNDAVSVKVKIVSITTTASGWDPIPVLKLTNEMRISRTYVFDCEANKVQQINFAAPQANADELAVSWVASEGADEYDLEWAYIDNSAYDTNAYGTPGTETFKKNIFKYNASRVTLNSTTNSYNIPLLYEKDGKLFFRVRAIQLTPPGRRTETNWSDYNSYDFAAGHQANLNWQSSTGFAEEGKRKSVVQYFDGSLRNRQTVTKDNTTNTTVVAESFYDYQGRPVIQVLPSPTINSIIQHTPNFNNFLNSSEYYKDNYDKASTNNDYCNGAAPALDAVKGGTAQYYSPQNPEKDAGNNKLIPDAKGFPYTETKYLQDNTGRVAAQSGVGPDHRLNSGHETKYYYGGADQAELDALFGTEAGDASHYFKNMVRDANGQYSASYLDLHGRTIATALAGDLPSSTKLDYLPSKQDSYITKTLTSPSNNMVKGLVIESSKGLLVAKAGNHKFNYSLLPENVNIKNCKQEDICYSCSYTLEITISDDCGNKQFGGTPYVYKDVVGNINTSCSNLPALFTRNFDKVLEEGSYTITKKLTIRDEAIKQHEQRFMENNLCKTVQDFVQEQKNIFLERTSNCATPCNTCSTQLSASPQAFIDKFIADNGLSAELAADRQLAQNAYNKLKEQCDEWCGIAKPQNYLDQLRMLMLHDVTPPYGQYANTTDFVLNGDTKLYYEHGIFGRVSSQSNMLKYTMPSIAYKNEDGSPATVTISRNGALVTLTPQQLTVDEFAASFQPSWAEALADNLHPEILKYNTLAKTITIFNEAAVGRASYDWDADFINTDTFEEALQKGYLNPTNYTLATARHPRQFTPNTSNTDPFFNKHITLRTQMHSYMNNVASGEGKVLDMWVAASVSSFCSEQNDIDCLNAQIADPFSVSGCTADLDMAWRSFRALYKARKDSLIIAMVNANAPGAPVIDTKKYHSYFTDVRTAIKNGTGINDINNKGDVEAALQDFYTDGSTCDGYATLWWNKLTPCDTEKLLPYKTQLLGDLVTVCQKGTDADHIMGASSIAPGATNTFKDFDEVLTHYVQLYNTANPGTPIGALDCNASLLNFPAPYSTPQVVDNKPIIEKPEVCECEKLSALRTSYEQEKKDADFSAYILRTLQTTISNGALDSLLNMCNGTINCRFIPQPIYLPPALQCGMDNACVPCSAVAQAYNYYKIQYPGYVPAMEETATPGQGKINELFSHYMNKRFGFNKPAQEYLAFMDSCRSGIIQYNSDTLKNIIDSFYLQAKPGRVGHQWGVGTPTPYTNLSDLAHDGVIYLPDSIRAVPATWYNNYQFNFNTFCTSNGYTIQSRFKFLQNDLFGDVFYLGFRSIQATFYRSGISFNGNPPGLYYHTIQLYGYGGGAVETINGYVLIDSNHNTLLDWMDFKVIVKPDKYELYYNDKKIFDYNRNPLIPIGNQQNFSLGLRGRHGAIDWIRVGDVNDSTKYFEDFNNISRPATVDPSFNCSGNTNCQLAFTNYFNQKQKTNYSYSEIASIYNLAGVTLDACAADTTPLPYSGPLLCGQTTPTAIPLEVENTSPCADSLEFAISRGYDRYAAYSDSVKGEFTKTFINKCLQAAAHESFAVRQPVSEYHYTLYYYDQAGNLVKTVPPKGVKPNYDETWLQQVRTARQNKTIVVPAHDMETQYRYNTFNQVAEQRSPDAGKSEFWYDRLGRLVISQNAKQAETNGTEGTGERYSYTQYDHLSRITEVGQINNASPAMTNNTSRNPTQLQNWMNSNITKRQQTTLTVYDQSAKESFLHKDLSPYIIQQRGNLRNRVSFTLFSKTGDVNNYDYAAFYNYDIHGNVDTLLQDYGATGLLAQNGSRYKRLTYQYDLISGKVNSVHYQPKLYDPVTKKYITQPDAFYHKYSYDAENRLTDVYTSTDELYWEHEVYYQYYKHGPLARTVLGNQHVQGLDYVYTLQGWLKGVNSTAFGNGQYDAGNDGLAGSANHYVARDAFGFSLQYYGSDYTPIKNSNSFADITGGFVGNAKPLYNGNISSMAVNIPRLGDARVYAYTYDQLNRITAMDTYSGLNNNNTFSPLAIDDYKERISYDPNGNILTYTRNGNKAGVQKPMDNLSYNYKNNTNQLVRVRDAVTAANYTEDIDDQPAGNYDYDNIGNLIKDTKEGITNIGWTVYGKIETITKTDGTAITYSYDAAGNRISKKVNEKETWYIRDAQGNTLSVYEQNSALNSGHFTQSELHLYGSSRLGIYNLNKDLTLTPPVATNLGSGNSGGFGIFERGKKFFELSNHLGNVLVTISDKKIGHDAGNGAIDYYTASVVSASDYYPFGMGMPGRKFSTEKYRYGFNGKENDKDITEGAQDYGMRISDSRLGRFLSVDPLTKKYPELTPYQFASNRPIDGVDMDGLEYVKRLHILAGNGMVIHTEDYVYYQMSENQLSALGGTSSGRYNAGGHGPKGEGVLHQYINASGELLRERWDLPRNSLIQSASTHGLYSGGGSITDGNGNCDFTWQPIDIADAIAKAHDMEYVSEAGGAEYQGYVEDVRTLAADRRMLQRIQAAENGQSAEDLGLETPFRDDIAGETSAALSGQKKFIGMLAEYKAWKVIQQNNGEGISILNEVDANNFINAADGWTNKKIRTFVTVPALQEAERQRTANQNE